MSNKSEATWHPNSGPTTDHADLIARLEALRDETPKTEAWERPLLSGHASYADRLHAAITEAAAALADSVPREQYDNVAALNEGATLAYGAMRAERDALAHVIEQAPHADTFCTAGEPYGQAECACWKPTVPAVSLARHDAEVKAQALDETLEILEDVDPDDMRDWLRARAAAIRAEANDHSN